MFRASAFFSLQAGKETVSVASNVRLKIVQSMYLLKLLPYLGEGLHFLVYVLEQEERITPGSTPCLFESQNTLCKHNVAFPRTRG